jgi:hypothetical protein
MPLTGVELIIRSLENNPDDWKQTKYVLEHQKGIKIWTSNGLDFLEIQAPEVIEIPKNDKKRLYAAILAWRVTKLRKIAKNL